MEQPAEISLNCLSQVRNTFPHNLEELIAKGVLTRNTNKLEQNYAGTVECDYRAIGCTFACKLAAGSVAVSGSCYAEKIANDGQRLMDDFTQR